MKFFAKSRGRIGIAALAVAVFSISASAKTFVYVSNAEDGDISTYMMTVDGELQPGARVKAAQLVMPMVVSADKRHLYAASRSKPFSMHAYNIDRATGALTSLAVSPLAESFPYISIDKTGRFLFGASYGGNLISVNTIGKDGRVSAEPLQTIPVGRNAHSIRTDQSNRFVYVPALGTDQIFQFMLNAKSGRLTANTPAVALMKAGTGPRHFIISQDNNFLYALSEMLATVTTFSIDSKTGLLTEVSSATGLPPGTKLGPGAPRAPVGVANAAPPRNTDNDIWAADIHMTPNGRFLYISERTDGMLAQFNIDAQTGKLTYIGSTPTEKQPRGFAIDGRGRFLIASGEKSETVSVYAIEQATGALQFLQKYPVGKGANWVEIVDFD
ncbi:MAG: beta-propeller fold lactonase family protein [Betaproteobacteria bacterium]